MPMTVEAPEPSAQEALRCRLALRTALVQIPHLNLTEPVLKAHLERTFRLYLGKPNQAPTWAFFLDQFFTLDWLVAIGCLENRSAAWELLFQARTGRSDCLLVDALRARASRLYPRDEEKRENSVAEFWSQLLVSTTDKGSAVLSRYDGKRPLAPWLIRVFQNMQLSQLRSTSSVASLNTDDPEIPLPALDATEIRWHEEFLVAGREWLASLPEAERLLLGLRWRYQLSQRDVATLLKVHEGTISRRTDKLRDSALTAIGERLTQQGWVGDDLSTFIITEMHNLLLDDPTLSADAIKQALRLQGLRPPITSPSA